MAAGARVILIAAFAGLLSGCAAGIVLGDDGSENCTKPGQQDCRKLR